MIATLFQGRAVIGNDHVIAPFMPIFNEGAVEQRTKDVEKAKSLLAEAGYEDGLQATLHAVDLQEIPQLAQLIQAGAAEAGIQLEIAVESGDTFYGTQWCPEGTPPCSGAAELGIVDYGHRPVPDVFLNAALSTGGVWNSSQYSNPAFDEAFADLFGVCRRRGPNRGGRHAGAAPQRRGSRRRAVLLQLPVRPHECVPGGSEFGAGPDVRGQGLESVT